MSCATPKCPNTPHVNPRTGVPYRLCKACSTKTLRTKRQLIRLNRKP